MPNNPNLYLQSRLRTLTMPATILGLVLLGAGCKKDASDHDSAYEGVWLSATTRVEEDTTNIPQLQYRLDMIRLNPSKEGLADIANDLMRNFFKSMSLPAPSTIRSDQIVYDPVEAKQVFGQNAENADFFSGILSNQSIAEGKGFSIGNTMFYPLNSTKRPLEALAAETSHLVQRMDYSSKDMLSEAFDAFVQLYIAKEKGQDRRYVRDLEGSFIDPLATLITQGKEAAVEQIIYNFSPHGTMIPREEAKRWLDDWARESLITHHIENVYLLVAMYRTSGDDAEAALKKFGRLLGTPQVATIQEAFDALMISQQYRPEMMPFLQQDSDGRLRIITKAYKR
ncbi:MAG: hypothetical protein KJ709_09330 [Nanoarchaeota archaeon]|nr:hypothetical protein [Nanoarchaeota archaeon]